MSSQQVETGSLLMFPGQGAQRMGMFQSMKESVEARAIFKRAQSIIGYDILDVCIAQGEELQEKLKSAEFVQVALLTGCIAKMEQIKVERPELTSQITHVAGLCLGEFAALVYAEVLNFEDALQIVRYQGQAIEHEMKHSPTGMVSTFGPESQHLQSYLSKHFPDMIISTFLGDNQHTIVGSDEDCNTLMNNLSEKAVRQNMNVIDVRRLQAAGAFHSAYMRSVAAKVSPIIEATHFSEPTLPIIMNVDGNVTMSLKDIKDLLKEQLVAPVKWKHSILTVYELGVRNFVEVAPLHELTSIVKERISECKNCNATFIET